MQNRLRLYSAIVMSIFVLCHLVDVSFALISFDLMEWGWVFSIAPWRTVPGTLLLSGAFVVHVGLAFWTVYRRKTLRLRGWEIPQNVFGFLIPALLVYHLMETRLAQAFWGMNEGDYTTQLLFFWVLAPSWCVVQFLLLIIAWTHSCVGFHAWLRLRRWYATYRPLIMAFFIVIPTLSLAGFVSGGMQIRRFAVEEGAETALENWKEEWGFTDEVYASIVHYSVISMVAYGGLIALCLLGRHVRIRILSRSRGAKVTYNSKVVLRVSPGDTLLDSLRAVGVRHASVCGGRGRCSTCRVRVTNGLESLESPSRVERTVLARISAPPAVRLACQLRPTTDLEVVSLLAPSVGPELAFSNPSQGEERELAVLFCDLRRFTELAEEKLPYDIVFILNRYFEAMGDAIEEAGGHIDKFMGDGVMALFGIGDGPAKGCRRALWAARLMATKLEDLNKTLANELKRPLRISIGIDVGRVIVGEMGHRNLRSLTAVGAPANMASRFQELCKDFDCQLILSTEVSAKSKSDLSNFQRHKVLVRGQAETREVHVIPSALEIGAGS